MLIPDEISYLYLVVDDLDALRQQPDLPEALRAKVFDIYLSAKVALRHAEKQLPPEYRRERSE